MSEPPPEGSLPNPDFTTNELLKKLRVDPDIPLPDPKLAPKIDQTKLTTWFEREEDPAMRRLKEKLVANIQHITFDAILKALSESSSPTKTALADKPYAVMFGEKPHSSEHWVYSLIKNSLPSPAFTTWFKGDRTAIEREYLAKFNERPEPLPNLTNMHSMAQVFDDLNIETFFFPDDISYTGKQMVEAVERFIAALKQVRPDAHPHIVINVPASTYSVKADLIDQPSFRPYSPEAKAFANVKITLIPPSIPLKSVGSILTPDDKNTLWQHGNRLNESDEKQLRMGATFAYADHKMPDHWTFPNAVAANIGLANYGWSHSNVPYKRKDTEYYLKEEAAYLKYRAQFVTD